ncbi:ethanolamine ammonia-lyase subunit EutC [Salipiger abyssi]|uniref:Ethanolamine ammonia-lyase small subunit n=1 Tax=Salipiger abyssi TaxID=1250539 RepID=A0A1P8V130_9RHOB|nr:ethanolamine ammonia-lyase subunit EutC [Salipiger abyssi]APZ55328.1 Ethanolamine ammonia-lyase light chain [Salipiger abyssi]
MSETEFPDVVHRLSDLTPSRVRLDPTGSAAPLSAVLDFQLSHARARDAIRSPADWEGITDALTGQGLEVLDLHSQAETRDIYIRRPDLGRRLAADSRARIAASAPDLAIAIVDGLSATAVSTHAANMVRAIAGALPEIAIGPVALVREGRVAIGDEIAAAMQAPLCLVLIGERPGLSVSDSLGAYLTWDPKPGTADSRRNCVSNIHGRGGLSYDRATDLLAFLIRKARELGATGVALKDDRPSTPALSAPD